jgi:hypothetical protein
MLQYFPPGSQCAWPWEEVFCTAITISIPSSTNISHLHTSYQFRKRWHGASTSTQNPTRPDQDHTFFPPESQTKNSQDAVRLVRWPLQGLENVVREIERWPHFPLPSFSHIKLLCCLYVPLPFSPSPSFPPFRAPLSHVWKLRRRRRRKSPFAL